MPGTGEVEKEPGREVDVINELEELLPDVSHVIQVRFATERDDEGVYTEHVAGQVEDDEQAWDDEEGTGDAQLGVMATSAQTQVFIVTRRSSGSRTRDDRAPTGRPSTGNWAADASSLQYEHGLAGSGFEGATMLGWYVARERLLASRRGTRVRLLVAIAAQTKHNHGIYLW